MKEIELKKVSIDELTDYLNAHIERFKGKGGIVLLIYSVVFTRTLA